MAGGDERDSHPATEEQYSLHVQSKSVIDVKRQVLQQKYAHRWVNVHV